MAVTTSAPIFSTAFYQNPYPTLAYLRQTTPVVRLKNTAGNPFWLITRYQDAVEALKDARLSKRSSHGTGPDHMLPLPRPIKRLMMAVLHPVMASTIIPISNNMLGMDDPDHARLRGLVHKSFTPQFIANMRGSIEGVVNRLIDGMQKSRQAEFIEAFAFRLPMTVIAELLGVPERDHAQFKVWTQSVMDAAGGLHAFKALHDIRNLNRYLRRLIADKRANPRDDLMSALVKVEEQGDKLSEDELLAMAFLLLTAGHETTVNLLGNGLLALLQHRDQYERLRSESGLMKSAVEELLRYDSPVLMATERHTTQEMAIGGVTIPKDEMVIVGLGAANRDPAQFATPDSLDLSRDPNRHVSFGVGSHYCLGAPLARMEASIAFEALLRRLPNLKLSTTVESLQWRQSMIIRGMKAMPLTL